VENGQFGVEEGLKMFAETTAQTIFTMGLMEIARRPAGSEARKQRKNLELALTTYTGATKQQASDMINEAVDDLKRRMPADEITPQNVLEYFRKPIENFQQRQELLSPEGAAAWAADNPDAAEGLSRVLGVPSRRFFEELGLPSMPKDERDAFRILVSEANEKVVGPGYASVQGEYEVGQAVQVGNKIYTVVQVGEDMFLKGDPGEMIPIVSEDQAAVEDQAQMPESAEVESTPVAQVEAAPVPIETQTPDEPDAAMVAERAAQEVISLPVFPELTSSQLDEVVGTVRAFYGR
jgi:hypothetical protein